ncbi:MAG: hypothetical protein K6T71_04480 [Candidatus Bipolaricaulota bacterium]|nr:hypothetical protein [Candidatus Bipolaricaulota bacterium]
MRKRYFVIGLIFSIIAGGLAGWLWWALGPGAPSGTTALPPVPPLPDTATPPVAPPSEPPSEVSDELPKFLSGILDSGTLVIEARGQLLGTEEYTLERREDGTLSLRSQGTLNFKIAVFSAQATFVQAIEFTAQRRPISYQFALQGPAGIGNRAVSARFGANTAIVDDGQKKTEIALPEEPFLLLGMFSSYAILPLWATRDTPQRLKVISLRGDRRNQGEIVVLLEYVGPVQLRDAQGDPLDAEEYLLKDERLTLKLYLSGDRLLALYNDTTERDRSFRLYRGDLFPQGLKP